MGITGLIERVEKLSDKRRTSHGNIQHKLVDIVTIGFLTIVCKGQTFVDMEAFAETRFDWLKNKVHLELKGGVPDSDTFRRVFELLDPKELSNCLWGWLEYERKTRCVVGIDGKTERGSENEVHTVLQFLFEEIRCDIAYVVHKLAYESALVHGVDVDSVNVIGHEVKDLIACEYESDLLDGCLVILVAVKLVEQSVGNLAARYLDHA